MTLEQQITNDLKEAMLAKESDRVAAIRAIKAAILVEQKSGSAHELTDADIIKLMQKLVKQRRESAEMYASAGRSELTEKELSEAAYIEEYLPRQMTAEELDAALRGIIAEVGASSPADMGKVMGAATRKLAGLADGKAVSEAVKRILAE